MKDSVMNSWNRTKEAPPPEEKQVGDAIEDSCGRVAKYAQAGCLLQTESGQAVGVYYGHILGPILLNADRTRIVFRFEGYDGLLEVLIEGKELNRIAEQFTLAKRETLRVTGPVTGIAVVKVEDDE